MSVHGAAGRPWSAHERDNLQLQQAMEDTGQSSLLDLPQAIQDLVIGTCACHDLVIGTAVAHAPAPEGRKRRRRRRKGPTADSDLDVLEEAKREADLDRAKLTEFLQQNSVECPGGHPLRIGVAGPGRLHCSACGNHVYEGVVHAICTEGDFVACEACMKALVQPK